MFTTAMVYIYIQVETKKNSRTSKVRNAACNAADLTWPPAVPLCSVLHCYTLKAGAACCRTCTVLHCCVLSYNFTSLSFWFFNFVPLFMASFHHFCPSDVFFIFWLRVYFFFFWIKLTEGVFFFWMSISFMPFNYPPMQ